MADSRETEKSKSAFWTTVPGILTGFAAIVTAVAALIGGLAQAGYFSRSTPSTHATETTKKANAATYGSTSPDDTVHPSNRIASVGHGPRDIPFTATATAGEAEYEVLSARIEDFGIDSSTHTATVLLRLRMRVTNQGKYPGLFTPAGFRLVVDGVVRAPKDSPSKTVEAGASEDGEITFIVPEDASRLSLRVGYSNEARADIPLNFPLK